MSVEVLDRPAGYMVYEMIGPRRFYVHPEKERWYQTAVGKAVLAKMAPHGLTSRDAYVSVETDSVAVHTDAGQIEIEDRTLSADGSALDCLFAAVAAGVAQERLLRLSGWKPDEEIPVWAVTASDVLVRQLDTKRVTPAQIWNADVCIVPECVRWNAQCGTRACACRCTCREPFSYFLCKRDILNKRKSTLGPP